MMLFPCWYKSKYNCF